MFDVEFLPCKKYRYSDRMSVVSQQLYFPLFDGTLFFLKTLSNNVRPWTLFDVEFLLTQKRRYCVEPPPSMADRCRIYLS